MSWQGMALCTAFALKQRRNGHHASLQSVCISIPASHSTLNCHFRNQYRPPTSLYSGGFDVAFPEAISSISTLIRSNRPHDALKRLRPRFSVSAASAAFFCSAASAAFFRSAVSTVLFSFCGFGGALLIRRIRPRLPIPQCPPHSGRVPSARVLHATNCLSNASTAFTRPSSSLPGRRASPISMSGSAGKPTVSGTRAMPGPVAVGNSVATPTPARTAA